MRFLVRFVPSIPARDPFLSTVRGLAKSVGADARNPKWTSYGALELDVFCPNRGDFDLFVSILRPMADIEFTRDLNIAPPHRPEQELFLEAREYFNAERYWECHEVLEGVWRLKSGAEKEYLQGLILLCAAFVHHQKGEEKVALSVLRRAAKQLDYPELGYGGLDVRAVRAQVDRMLQTGEVAVFRV